MHEGGFQAALASHHGGGRSKLIGRELMHVIGAMGKIENLFPMAGTHARVARAVLKVVCRENRGSTLLFA
jgi:hypothetical protein